MSSGAWKWGRIRGLARPCFLWRDWTRLTDRTSHHHSTGCLDLRVKLAGKELLLDKGWHDPPHYLTRLTERPGQGQEQEREQEQTAGAVEVEKEVEKKA